MIGRAICLNIKEQGWLYDPVPHSECDLLCFTETYKRIKEYNPDAVIHAAGWNGGIEWNKKYPAEIFYRTAQMGLNVLRASQKVGVKRCLSIMASCSYPDKQQDVLVEKDMWNGLPNSTVECHGLSKRMLNAYSRQISKQYDYNYTSCVLTNSFGPYDSFHYSKTKVVGALIRKFVEAKQQNLPFVECWGTGAPLREFIYCYDAGKIIVDLLEKYKHVELVNVGSGIEMSIKELTDLIVECVGYTGEVRWDTSKPDGQMRKKLNTNSINQFLNIKQTPIREALQNTINFYIANKETLDKKEILW